MENKGGPTAKENSKKNSQCNRSFHVSSVMDCAGGQRGDLFGMRSSQEEHVDVEAQYEKHHQREQDGEGNDCRCFIGEEGNGNAAAGTERPNDCQDSQGPPQGHDVVVPQSVEDSDVSICCNS